MLNPILVTGATVLVADDLLDRFRQAARTWLTQRGTSVELTDERHDGFHRIQGSGRDWGPRLYVSLITDLFQEGVTRCLVGTRGLLGEGWDATKLNVLIDLTAVTTSMTVNQLRGRSLRLDPDDPAKLANNWDVVCIAPEFTKGLDDYQRFRAKHQHLFGVTDDGAIEKGVGHVHAAFTTLKPEGVEDSVTMLNAEMLERVPKRADYRAAVAHWRSLSSRAGACAGDWAIRVEAGRLSRRLPGAAIPGRTTRSVWPLATRCWRRCRTPS